jgi:plasmid maintenance system antidote protein VapI
MNKIIALFDSAIAAQAKKEKRLKRTIRKHVVAALVSQTAGKLLELSERQATDLLDGKVTIEPPVAILLSSILGITAREILDAQTDDQLAAEGDASARGVAAEANPLPAKASTRSKPAATRTSPMKPAQRRTEVTGTL